MWSSVIATVESTVIDEIDNAIIRELQRNARLSNVELGRAVGLSPNAAGVRVQRLVQRGVISGFHAAIDHAALGRPIEASIDIWLGEDRNRDAMMHVVADDDRITECFHLTGPVDFRLRARVASTDDLNDLLVRLRTEGGTRQTDSRLLLERLAVHPE